MKSIAEMNNSRASLNDTSDLSSKPAHRSNKDKSATVDDIIAINEKVYLTKNQYEVLNMICKSYEKSFSEYMQVALVRSMQSDIEDGNLCDTLLDKIDMGDDKEMKQNNNSPTSSNTINDEVEMLRKLQTTLP